MIATLFVHPVSLGSNYIWLVVPLCAIVAMVYKAVRVRHLRQLPLEVLRLWAFMLVGLVALGTAFYVLLEYVP